MKSIIFVVACLLCGNALAVGFGDYMPTGTARMNAENGMQYSRYTITPIKKRSLASEFAAFGKSGSGALMKKEYGLTGKWELATTAVLFYGKDGTVTELGDYMRDGTLSYATNGAVTGIEWNPSAEIAFDILRAGAATGYAAYSQTRLIERIKSYTPRYGAKNGKWGRGNGKTYKDVVHIVTYHGVQKIGLASTTKDCEMPVSRKGVQYARRGNYDSYAMEYYLAKGVGIIEEITPYVENGGYWGMEDCTGAISGKLYQGWFNFHTYRAN